MTQMTKNIWPFTQNRFVLVFFYLRLARSSWPFCSLQLDLAPNALTGLKVSYWDWSEISWLSFGLATVVQLGIGFGVDKRSRHFPT